MTDKKRAELIEEKARLLIRNSYPVLEWAKKHSPNDVIFTSAVSGLLTIEELEEILKEPKEEERASKYANQTLF